MTSFAFAHIGESNFANFSSLYQLAFILPFLILLIVGIKRKYDMSRWLAILLVSSFCMLLGSRISTFTTSEWSDLLMNGIWPGTYAKFALGGLVLALAGIYISKRVLKFDQPVFRIFAWVAPIGLAIQKIGCLFAGCCHGVSTMLPWGVRYTPGGIEFPGPGIEGSIHPTQLYQILIYLSISLAVLLVMRRFRRDESVAGFALALLFSSRFLLEFLIDPLATNIGGNYFLGLKVIQWMLIIGFFLSLLMIYAFEKQSTVRRMRNSTQQGMLHPLIIFITIAVLFVLVHNAFSFNEMFAFNIRFTIITIMFGVILAFRLSPPKLRWLSPAILILPLLLLSQNFPYDTKDYDKVHIFSSAMSMGEYYNQLKYNPHQVTNCSGDRVTAYDRTVFENSQFTGALGYGREGRLGFKNYRYGAFLNAGSVSERREDLSDFSKFPFLAIHSYAEYNERWAGIGGNLNLGYLPTLQWSSSSNYLPDDNHKLRFIVPGFSLRVGPYDILDARVRYASGFPSMLPSHLLDLSLGTGFGIKNGSGIRVGTSLPLEESIFFEGNIVLKKLQINLMYIHNTNHFSYPENTYNKEFNIGVSYRLPVK